MRRLSVKDSKNRDRVKRSPIREDSFGLDAGLESLNINARPRKVYQSKTYRDSDTEDEPIDEYYEEDAYKTIDEAEDEDEDEDEHEAEDEHETIDEKVEDIKAKKSKRPKLNKRGKPNKTIEERSLKGRPNKLKRSEKKSATVVDKHKVEKIPNTKPRKILLIILIIVGLMFIVGSYVGYSLSQKSIPSNTTTNSNSTPNNNAEADDAKDKKKQELAEAITKATKSVTLVETSLLEEDYIKAVNTVNALEDCTEKDDLVARLEKIKSTLSKTSSTQPESDSTQPESDSTANPNNNDANPSNNTSSSDSGNATPSTPPSTNSSSSSSSSSNSTSGSSSNGSSSNSSSSSHSNSSSNTSTTQTPPKREPTGHSKVVIVDDKGNIYYK